MLAFVSQSPQHTVLHRNLKVALTVSFIETLVETQQVKPYQLKPCGMFV